MVRLFKRSLVTNTRTEDKQLKLFLCACNQHTVITEKNLVRPADGHYFFYHFLTFDSIPRYAQSKKTMIHYYYFIDLRLPDHNMSEMDKITIAVASINKKLALYYFENLIGARAGCQTLELQIHCKILLKR